MHSYHLPHLQLLESESIFIFRELAEQFQRPVLLFSGGKDSITLVRLAQKAFWPAKIPFPILHVDTGHNFPEAIAYRDQLVKDTGVELIVASVQDTAARWGFWHGGQFADDYRRQFDELPSQTLRLRG